ncbi:hypothetical protein V8C42DRAFT_356369 [Trichoderma barbatum]
MKDSPSALNKACGLAAKPASPTPATLRTGQRRVRKAVNVACDACRKRKTKCNGDRPKCAGCVTQMIECNYYSASREETNAGVLKRKYQEVDKELTAHKELFTALRTFPKDDAMAILNLVRQGGNVTAILQQFPVIPETRRGYEFPCVASMPTHLQTPDNLYLKSLLYEKAFQKTDYKDSDGNKQPQHLHPYHAAKLCDPLIDRLEPSKWTNAMIDHDAKFCSPVLVNALLAEACHSFTGIPNRHQFWNTQSLRYRFLAEAKRLWDLQSNIADLVSVQTATLLSLIYSHNGMDKIGYPYLMHALQIAQQLDLFGNHANKTDEKMDHARVFTAWALFNWQCSSHDSIQSYYYYRAPVIHGPPAEPLPSIHEYPLWYGDFSLEYPQEPTLVPAQWGHSFKAICRLRSIIHDMAILNFNEKEDTTVSPSQIYSIVSRLENWYEGLPIALLASSIVFPWQLKVHMELYLATILFFAKQAEVLETSALMKEVAREITAHATAHLETVGRIYYTGHSFLYGDLVLTIHLPFIAGAAMRRLRLTPVQDAVTIESLRSTIILSLKGLHDQGRSIHFASIIFRLVRDLLEPRDLVLLQECLASDLLAPEEPLLVERARSHYPLTMGNKHKNPAHVRLENLVQQYNH